MSAFGPIISEIVGVIRELSADPIGKKVINQLINLIIELIGQNAISSVKKNELFCVNQSNYALRIPIVLFSSEKHNYLSTMVWTVHKLKIRLPISQKKNFSPH